MLSDVPSTDENGYGEDVPPKDQVQTSVRMPTDLHARFNAAAEAVGMSFNAFLCEAAEQMLGGSLRNPASRLQRLEHDIRDLKHRVRQLEEER